VDWVAKKTYSTFRGGLSRQAKGKVMSIGLRITIGLVCAYAGWYTASVQFGELP
jgi:hypothetical protein